MNVHKALEYLENLDASSEDDLSDDEDFISRGRLVILSPNNDGDRDTDEVSGEVWNNLNRVQVFAGATIDLSTSSGNILLGVGDEEKGAGPSVNVSLKRNKKSKVNGLL